MSKPIAQKTTREAAQAHFENGGTVLVSDGGAATVPVTRFTVTHSNRTNTWSALVEQVDFWHDRHPGQNFYVVGTPGTE